MRISANQIYQRGLNNIMAQQERLSKIAQQFASGQKVEIPSDDPIAAAQIDLINQRMGITDILQKNRQNAENSLGFEEKILDGVMPVLLRLKDLQLSSINDAMSGSDRKSLAVEAKILLNELQNYANTLDSNGNFLFSGGKTTTQAISLDASGQYVYNGDSTQRFLPVSGTLQIATNDTADALFMRILNGNGNFTVQTGAIPNAGTGSVTTGTVTNPTAYVADDYTMTLATNTQGQLVVMVTGATSGNVLPPSGLADDAPLYTEGGVVSFNGMELTMNGVPQAGDSFVINPAKNESIFSTVQRMISNLSKPYDTATEKAATKTENNQLLSQLESAFNNISDYRSQLGARLQQLESADNANTNLMDICEQTRSQLRDADMTQVVTDLKRQEVSLQMAQQSFARIQSLSLFNFL